MKEKIINAAYKLFCEYGYENTSVQKIVDESGTSKGGFYHHFKTKEDIVEEITHGFVIELEKRYKKMTEDNSLSVYEKMNRVTQELNEYKSSMMGDWPGLMKMFSFEGNIRIIHSMAMQFESLAKKTYYSIIEQGIIQNEFHTDYPMQAAQLFARETLNIYTWIDKIIFTQDPKIYDEFILNLEFMQDVLNNALGMKENRLKIKEEAIKYLEKAKVNYKGVVK